MGSGPNQVAPEVSKSQVSSLGGLLESASRKTAAKSSNLHCGHKNRDYFGRLYIHVFRLAVERHRNEKSGEAGLSFCCRPLATVWAWAMCGASRTWPFETAAEFSSFRTF